MTRDAPAWRPAVRPTADVTDPMNRRRLRELHSDPRSRSFLSRVGLPETASCVEIGAGLGSMARWLASDIAPRGSVLATERRPELVAAISAAGGSNLRAVCHDVRTEPLPVGDLDLIYGRFVLEHIEERDALIPRLCEHLRPGGWLVLEDAVFMEATLTGPPAYRAAMLGFAAGKTGTDYHWADRLPDHLRAAGMVDVCAQRVSDLFDSGSVTARFWASVLAQERPADTGATDVSAVDAAVDALLSGSAWFGGPLVVQCAGRAGPRRPDGPQQPSGTRHAAGPGTG